MRTFGVTKGRDVRMELVILFQAYPRRQRTGPQASLPASSRSERRTLVSDHQRAPPRQPKRLPPLLPKEGNFLLSSLHAPPTLSPTSEKFPIPQPYASRRIPTC